MMSDLSFIEKLKLLVDVSSSSGIGIIGIIILLFMAILFLTTTEKNAKVKRITFIGIYSILLGILLWQYQSSLGKMFDYMMNNFFIAFYFPNIAIYLAAIIATNIILFTSIFNFKEDRLIKVINTIIYCIIHYLLILILNIICHKKLDVFSQTSIYGNEKVAVLISLTSIIFIVWIIFLIIYKIIRKTQKKEVKEEKTKIETIVETKYIEVPVKMLNPNIKPTTIPNIVRGNIKKCEKSIKNISMPFYIQGKLPKLEPITKYVEIPVKKTNPNILAIDAPSLVYDNRHKEIKPNNIKNQLEEIESILTLDDYKIVLDILTNHKDILHKNEITKDHNNSNTNFEEEYFPSMLDELLNL